MKDADLIQLRLINQQLIKQKYNSPAKLVKFMGAIQAQDFAMSKWAVGLRTINSTQKKIEAAFNKGIILRTHVLRPTWHLVSAEDIYWMLDLTASNIKARMRTNDKKLGITETLFKKSNKILEKALTENEHLNRDEIINLFNAHKIIINENRLSHFLMRAELEAIICSGKIVSNKNIYTLLSKRVEKKIMLYRDEALATLAKKYFMSRGPATVADFIWWSGLSITEAKKAVSSINEILEKVTVDKVDYYFNSTLTENKNLTETCLALPAFDEYLISYKNRSHILHSNKKNISANGIFWPVILIDGKVSGMWSRKAENGNLIIKAEYFIQPTQLVKNNLIKNFKTLGRFLNKHVIIDGKVPG